MTGIVDQYKSSGDQYEYYVKTAPMRQIDEQTALSMIGDLTGKSVLDLACGYGHFTQEFYRRGTSKVIGVDVSSHMIKIAREKAKINGYPIEFRVHDVTKMGCIGSFDMVTAVWLFNYASSLEELYLMFKACFNNLTEKGTLVCLTVNPDYSLEKGNYTQYGFRILSEKQLGDTVQMEAEFITPQPYSITFYRYSRKDYERTLKKAGFTRFEWVQPILGEGDVARYGSEFWDVFHFNSLEIGLICKV